MSANNQSSFPVEHPENIRRRRIISMVSLILIFALFALISWKVGAPLVRQFRESPETFRAYVDGHGLLGQLMMVGIIMLQVVVAFIPGEPFELGAGFVFGWFEGTLLCLIGQAIAGTLIYAGTRKWGVKMVEAFFPREKIMQYSFLRNEKKLNLLVFILFLIPGTPKDLLVYLVGLTPMKLTTFLTLSTVARIPSVVSSAVTGSLAQRGSYTAAIVTYGITLLISAVCVLWYRKVSRQEKQQSGEKKA